MECTPRVYRFQRGDRNEITMIQACCHACRWAGAALVQDAPRQNEYGYVTDQMAHDKARADVAAHAAARAAQ